MIEKDTKMNGLFLGSDLWQFRVPVLVGAFIGLVLGVLIILLAQQTYETKMILFPTPQLHAETQSPNLLNLSSIARFNAFEGSFSLVNKTTGMFQTLMHNPRAAALVLNQQGVKEKIAQHKAYGFFAHDTGNWTPEDMAVYLKDHLEIVPGQAIQGMLTVSYKHPDPAFAQKLLLRLHAVTDELIRNDYKTLTEDRIAFVNRALEKAINPEHRRGLSELLLRLERQSIMVNADRSFAMQILDPPATRHDRSYPNKFLVIFIFLGGGMLAGLFTGLHGKP